MVLAVDLLLHRITHVHRKAAVLATNENIRVQNERLDDLGLLESRIFDGQALPRICVGSRLAQEGMLMTTGSYLVRADE